MLRFDMAIPARPKTHQQMIRNAIKFYTSWQKRHFKIYFKIGKRL